MTKYKEYFIKMTEENKELFSQFKMIHDQYTLDPDKWKGTFNYEGKKVQDVIRDWERRLCQHSERGKFGVFSENLSDKFWSEVRKMFPKIDYIGVT